MTLLGLAVLIQMLVCEYPAGIPGNRNKFIQNHHHHHDGTGQVGTIGIIIIWNVSAPLGNICMWLRLSASPTEARSIRFLMLIENVVLIKEAPATLPLWLLRIFHRYFFERLEWIEKSR